MSRYIDADKLWNDRPQVTPEKSLDYKAGFSECMWAFSKLIREQIDNSASDVVPRSEVEISQHLLKDAWKRIEEFDNLCEELQRKYDLAVAEREANVKGFTEELEKAKTDLDLLKSTITHKEEEAYNKGYEDAKADILEKLQADIARDEVLAEYGDELFEGRIAGFKVVMNYLNAEGEK